ncbi:MAG: HemK2/MTQ2 family protein methyltransferase [Candidatus Bathycorpusculaceae bacterium]
MSSSAKKAFFADCMFQIWENVYEPAEDTFLFAENLTLTVRKDDSVLDMGTGCGILGILAAEKASRVVAIDINPHSIRCAKENADLNHVGDKMFFVQGDLFRPLKVEEKFDLILFNAPYLPVENGEEGSWLERAWTDGTNGNRLIDRFISEAAQHLKQEGQILLMQSTLSDINQTLLRFEEHGFKVHVAAEKALELFETLKLLNAKRIC